MDAKQKWAYMGLGVFFALVVQSLFFVLNSNAKAENADNFLGDLISEEKSSKLPKILILNGVPSVRVISFFEDTKSEQLSDSQKNEFRLMVTRAGDEYIWESREKKPLLKSRSGVYVYFISPTGGYIKIGTKSLTYMEHLNMGLLTVTYWGKLEHFQDDNLVDALPAPNQPKLSEVRSFTIYAKEGEFKKINLTDGKIVEQKPDNGFQNGEIQFVLLGKEKALLIGNAGTAEVGVVQEEGSISFVETTPSGNQHVLIIYDEWDRKEGGFRFTYTRNVVDDFLLLATMRSTYKGIAKPDIGK